MTLDIRTGESVRKTEKDGINFPRKIGEEIVFFRQRREVSLAQSAGYDEKLIELNPPMSSIQRRQCENAVPSGIDSGKK